MPSNQPRSPARWPFYAFIAVYLGLHAYLYKRLGFDPDWGSSVQWLSALVVGGLSLAAPLRFLGPGNHNLPAAWARLWAFITFSWMGAAFLLVVSLALTDLGLFLTRQFSEVLAGLSPTELARLQAGGVLVFVGALSSFAFYSALRTPSVRRVRVELKGWPKELDGYKVLQLSDVHVGPIIDRGFLGRVIDRSNACDPDLVVVTGDLVDGPVEQYGGELAPFDGLKSKDGAFMVIGNHDHYANESAWVPQFEARGLQCLRNRHVVIGKGDARFVLAGIDDTSSSSKTVTASLVATSMEESPKDLPHLFLAHNPNAFDAAAEHGVGLQLSGHTHGGQIWPFNFLVRLAHEEVAGMYERGSLPSQLYVSRGTGFWGPPMRLGAKSEITELTLVGV